DLLGQQFRVAVIDRFNAEEGEISLVFLGWPDLTRNHRARAQAKPANLAWRNIDVVGAGEIVVIRTAQESEAVRQNFQRALAEHESVLLHPLLKDLKNEILFLQAGVIDQSFVLSHLEELRHAHLLQRADVRAAALDLLVTVVDFLVESTVTRFR